MLAVALDSAGAAAVRDFIRPPEQNRAMLAFMGWEGELADRAAPPRYPCLIDERHAVAELYGIANVPSAVWIDEAGHVVRPPEHPGTTDSFRSLDFTTGRVAPERLADARLRRRTYVDAVRDWIEHGPASRHVLTPDEVRRRMRGVERDESLATAHFRIGLWLARAGELAAAHVHFDEALRLRPDRWTFRRQKIVLSDPALTGQLAATPEYWQAVRALGGDYYYPPVDMEGMPPPLPPPT